MTLPAGEDLVEALRARLAAVHPLLTSGSALRDDDPGDLLDQLVAAVRSDPANDRVWLLLAAVTGDLPLESDVAGARRDLEVADDATTMRNLLDRTADSAGYHRPHACVVLQDAAVFDAGHTALDTRRTGIQRVVREVLRRWTRTRPLHVTAWTDDYRAMRTTTFEEFRRAARHDETEPDRPETDDAQTAGDVELEGGVPAGSRLVLPWRTSVVMAELPPEAGRRERLRCLARFSGNRLAVVGYDAIPAFGSEYVAVNEAEKFASYLSMVKHADRIVSISESSALEYEGFTSMLPAQGLQPPQVSVCPLPVDVPLSAAAHGATPQHQHQHQPADSRTLPLVTSIGTLEPRKNQAAVLHAASLLWRDGVRFELVLVGGVTGEGKVVAEQVEALAAEGRPVRLARGLDDREVADLLRRSRLTVFVSVYEGFGLPVAESLAYGVPVVTSDVGSMREIARGGGAVLVDPHDDRAIAAGMRSLLDDDELHARLTEQARSRPTRTWDDYADELWDALGLQAVTR
jgi:glycosyltransferase involved in cell wall biosynthesis